MLRFNSEEKRMQHPQAHLIPKPVWDNVFLVKTLNKHQLALMQTPTSELDSKLADLNPASLDGFEKQALWICIALSHPTISNEELMRIAHDVFAMRPEIILKMAVAFGKIDFFNQVLTTYPEIARTITSGDYSVFFDAATYGHLDILEKILSLAPNADRVKHMLSADKHHPYCVFMEAARGGNLAIIERLLTLATEHNISIRDMIKNHARGNNYWPFRLAAANGHIDVLERLLNLAPFYNISIKDMIAEDGYIALRIAAENVQLGMVKKLLEIAPWHVI